MKTRDSVTKNFSNENTLGSGVAGGLDDDGFFVFLEKEVGCVEDISAAAESFLSDLNFVFGSGACVFFSGVDSTVLVEGGGHTGNFFHFEKFF